jgi:aminocarboxymuconate-semialdehyde decarboxylase
VTTRREFLGKSLTAAAGLVFTGCGTTGTEQPRSATSGARAPIVIGGRRVKTIDIHAHCVVPEAMAIMKRPVQPVALDMAQDRLRVMDAQGIDMEALSINPIWYTLERDVVAKVVSLQNEKLAEVSAGNPERFVAFASVALQYPDLAVQQLEHAIKKLNLRGVAVGSRVGPLEFADPKFHAFWAKAEELGVLIFIHPAGTPELNKRLKGNGVLENVIGNPLDTTIALSHLIFQGTLDRFPGLKVCAAHGGGYLPHYKDRSDQGCITFPERCDTNIKLKKKPTEYLTQMYFDSLIFTSDALQHLARQVGSDRIMLGTDYPFPWTDRGVQHILAAEGFSDREKAAMLGDTAARLLNIKI